MIPETKVIGALLKEEALNQENTLVIVKKKHLAENKTYIYDDRIMYISYHGELLWSK